MKNILKKLIAGVVLLFALLFSFVAPVNYTPLHNRPFYQRMMKKLDTLYLDNYAPTQPLRAGWSLFSIVPDHPVRMAGYGIREKFDAVSDSLHIRILALDNGGITAYFISADLLLFPPAVRELVFQKLPPSRQGFLFFGATHTHSGVGGWAPSTVGEVLLGNYDSDWVESVAQGIVDHIERATSDLKRATLYTWQANADKYTYNRVLSTFDRVDSKVRGLKVVRNDSSKALLFVYGGHPTLLSKSNTVLSNDYISKVFEKLGKEYDFVQFMGGMMAGQTVARSKKADPDYLSHLGDVFTALIQQAKTTPLDEFTIGVARIEMEQGHSQLRIAKDWRLRDWVFKWLLGPLKAEITLLQLGDILFLGLSCDFSGQLSSDYNYDSIASHYGKKLVITGFNGKYTGYITPDYLYSAKPHDSEVKEMNWVGPYFGQYYTEVIEKVMATASKQRAHKREMNSVPATRPTRSIGLNTGQR